METTTPLTLSPGAIQRPLTVVSPLTTGVQVDESENKPIDTELFIRKVFESDAKKGCELLFRHYYRSLCAHACRFVYSKEVAEDLVADVFYTFWDTAAYRSVQHSYRAYLFRSVRNRSYNYLASEHKKLDNLEVAEKQEAPLADLPESIMSYEELYHRVDKLVAELPPQCRKVFIMFRFESRRAKEIAQELKLSVRTVEMHIAKALSILRAGLKDQWLVVACLTWLENGV